jgi:hypothetical protein
MACRRKGVFLRPELELGLRDALMAITKSGASQVNSILLVFSVQTAVLRQGSSRIAIGQVTNWTCRRADDIRKAGGGISNDG